MTLRGLPVTVGNGVRGQNPQVAKDLGPGARVLQPLPQAPVA